MKTPDKLSYYKDLLKRLQDPDYAMGYLNETLKDEDKNVFLLALRDVADAHGNLSKVAKQAKISREHIYRMLSKKGNPSLKTLQAILDTVGLKLAIEKKSRRKNAA